MNKILNVDGMTCDHCVSTIKKAVMNHIGVLSVEVKIEIKQVIIEFDETIAKIEGVIENIIEAGFQVRM